ncbi:MAG: hypothetical protein HS115_11685 [Spirochaetales bacterium]|nr:hypothetical protein [Spirochaetales bacterium]
MISGCLSLPQEARVRRDNVCQGSFKSTAGTLIIPPEAVVAPRELRTIEHSHFVPAFRYNHLVTHAADLSRCLQAEQCLRKWTEWERDCRAEQIRQLRHSPLPAALQLFQSCKITKPACPEPVSMYSATVKERAFALYLQGHNPEQIAAALRPQYARLSANTVRKWAEPGDPEQSWDARRSDVDRAVRRRIEEQSATARVQIRHQVQTLRQSLYERLVSEQAPEAKSFEGSVYAFRALLKAEMDIEAEAENRFSPLMAAEALLEALHDHPEVRKVLKKHWVEIKGIIAGKLNHLTQTREIEVT